MSSAPLSDRDAADHLWLGARRDRRAGGVHEIGEVISERESVMPIISNFFGIIIRMFFNEHAPPHFHVEYAEYKATVNIQTLEIIEGKLTRRAQELVLDWAELHQQELSENWELCRKHLDPKPIDPLR